MTGPTTLPAAPLDAAAFAPFGSVLGLPAGEPTLARGDITFWHATGDLAGLAGSGVTGHLIAHRREARLTRIERHVRTPEVFLALTGRSLFVVGAPGDADPAGLRAFVLEAGQGVLLHPGTWHWAPYPLTETATFLLVLRAETPEHDIETFDIPPRHLEASPVPGP